jgi:phospholipase B1
VGALGDSITAGFGARSSSLVDLAVEWRGVSWTIGGDDGAATVPSGADPRGRARRILQS